VSISLVEESLLLLIVGQLTRST
ncbi:unnamed protein product, partial [Rotaria magnacalcarata]